MCFWKHAAMARGRGLVLSRKAPDPGDDTGGAVKMKDVQHAVWPEDPTS